jgi:hypothetical protein
LAQVEALIKTTMELQAGLARAAAGWESSVTELRTERAERADLKAQLKVEADRSRADLKAQLKVEADRSRAEVADLKAQLCGEQLALLDDMDKMKLAVTRLEVDVKGLKAERAAAPPSDTVLIASLRGEVHALKHAPVA